MRFSHEKYPYPGYHSVDTPGEAQLWFEREHLQKNIPSRAPFLLCTALRRFPNAVRTEHRRALERKKFLKETFGALVKELEKERRRR